MDPAQAPQIATGLSGISLGDILSLAEGLTVRGMLLVGLWAFLTEKIVPIGRLRESQAREKAWRDAALTAIPALKRLVEKE